MTKASAHGTVTVSAVITRADGTVEDLGVIATTASPSPWARLRARLTHRKEHTDDHR